MRTHKPFKEPLKTHSKEPRPRQRAGAGNRQGVVINARPLILRPNIDPTGLNKLVDELEVEEFLRLQNAAEE